MLSPGPRQMATRATENFAISGSQSHGTCSSQRGQQLVQQAELSVEEIAPDQRDGDDGGDGGKEVEGGEERGRTAARLSAIATASDPTTMAGTPMTTKKPCCQRRQKSVAEESSVVLEADELDVARSPSPRRSRSVRLTKAATRIGSSPNASRTIAGDKDIRGEPVAQRRAARGSLGTVGRWAPAARRARLFPREEIRITSASRRRVALRSASVWRGPRRSARLVQGRQKFVAHLASQAGTIGSSLASASCVA